MTINVGYFVRESVVNFRRNWVMSLGAVITIYLSLLLVGISFATGFVVTKIVQDVESKVEVQIFLKDGFAEEDMLELQQFLASDPLVETVNYTSKEEALEKFKEQMKESPEIIEQMEGNPLPASLDVKLVDPREVETVVAKIKANPTFLEVADKPDDPEQSLKYAKQIVNRLFALTRVVRIVEIVFIAMLALVSLIFINNTIRLAIYARRKEIGIMRLVGASNWFIRTPFLLEGVFQALIGATLAIVSIVAMERAIMPRLTQVLSFLGDLGVGSAAMAQIGVILVAAGTVIGLIGSGLALRRYLKV